MQMLAIVASVAMCDAMLKLEANRTYNKRHVKRNNPFKPDINVALTWLIMRYLPTPELRSPIRLQF